MAKQDNPFSLLGEDDDGGDITVLLAKVEAKISATSAAAAVDEHPKPRTKPRADEFSSKSLPLQELARAERARGRGDRSRGLGRVGFRSGCSGGADNEASENLVDGYSRSLGSDSGVRGRGRGGRGGRGRGRGRGFSEGRGLDNDNQNDAGIENQDKVGYFLDEGDDAQARNSVPTEYHAGIYESRKFGDDRRSHGWEEKGYDGDNRRFRGGEGHETRGFGGGRHGKRGGVGMRYVVKEPLPAGNNDGWNEPQNKEDALSGKELLENNAVAGNVASGWEMPEATNVPKGEESDNAEQKQLVPGEVPEDKNPKEEDNEMTLDEYEKVLQEKRKALESLKAEERKVAADKDFESMLLIEKKTEGEFIKLKIEKEKLKKDSFEKEEKVRKSLSINEFLKPAEGERYARPSSGRGRASGRGRGRGDRGGFRGGYAGGRGGHDVPALHFDDPAQFPLLGAAAKA